MNPLALNKCRFINNDELKYSLRSVQKFASWINHIYIITDNQIPKWLNVKNKKITIIDHKQIMPEKCLPCFNSSLIEMFIHKIPNLSEFFVVSGDDMFMGNYLKPSFFFNKQQKPIVRVSYCNFNNFINCDNIYLNKLFNIFTKIKKVYGKKYNRCPSHQISPYRKSFIEYNQMNNIICKDLCKTTLNSKFRTNQDFSTHIYTVLDFINNKNVVVIINNNYDRLKKLFLRFVACFIPSKSYRFLVRSAFESLVYVGSSKNPYVLFKIKPKLFCLNDDENATDETRRRVRDFMKDYFPEKSEFEL